MVFDSHDNVYVVDTRNTRIQKFSSDGDFITSWGKNWVRPGEFMIAHDVDADSNDNIYVVDQRDAHHKKKIVKKFLPPFK